MRKPTKKDLEEALHDELLSLWTDLTQARGTAINTDWSIRCGDIAHRIKQLTKLVGPTDWEYVSIDLLEAGIYQRLHAEIDVTVEVDMARVAEVRANIERRRAGIRGWS